MKKTPLYAAFLLMALFIYTGCSNDDDDELVGNWSRMGDFDGVSRSGAALFMIGDDAYVATGYDGKKRLNDLWVYNNNGSWTQKAEFPGTPRNYASAFGTANAGFLGLGEDADGEYLGDFWKYDPASNSWSEIAPFLGAARHSAVAFSINGTGYVGTGYDGNPMKDFYSYNPSTNTWTAIDGLGGTKRRGAMAFVINNIGYVFGGENNESAVNDFWAFDPSKGQWIEKRKTANVTSDSFDDDYTSISRSYGAAFVLDGKAYVSTGRRNSYTISNTWEYTPQTDLWYELTGFEAAARYEAVGFSSKGRGYVLNGRTAQNQLSDMHEFHPFDEVDEYDN